MHRPKTTIIYCLKNPLDRNRVFYVGRTSQTLIRRLYGHINHPANSRLRTIINEIKSTGKKPLISQLEICEGYHAPYIRERFWVSHYNKRKYQLANAALKVKKAKTQVPSNHYYW